MNGRRYSHFYAFTRAERLILVVLIAGVIALELVNSAIERAVDKPDPEHDMAAGAAKDMAAGAVLAFSIGAAVCGAVLFWDLPTLRGILAYFLGAWYRIPVLAAALVGGYLFVFCYRKRGSGEGPHPIRPNRSLSPSSAGRMSASPVCSTRWWGKNWRS